MRYWLRDGYDTRGQLMVETSRAYELVESYVASLFMRDPAVVVRGDLRGRGDQDKAQALANDWLAHVRRQMEDALRLSIIYPWAALKVAPRSHPDPLHGSLRPCRPDRRRLNTDQLSQAPVRGTPPIAAPVSSSAAVRSVTAVGKLDRAPTRTPRWVAPPV